MTWLTVQEAAGKWQISQRTVQYHCKAGNITGAKLFNRNWAIPVEASPPAKRRDTLSPVVASGFIRDSIYSLLSFETLTAALEQFPFSLNISLADGIMVFANSKFMEGTLESARKEAIGNYNILTESNLEVWGLKNHVERAFNGEIITTRMVKFPNKEMIDFRYGKEHAFINIYQDITSFPLFDDQGQLTHVVTYFVPSEKCYDRIEIMAAKAYIDNHWSEPLSISMIAKEVNLSASRISSLFKSEVGFTLHDYYLDTKMRHLCERLTHPDLSISDAFSAVGIAYNSHYTALFKDHTGMPPRQYRLHKKLLG